MFFSCKEVFGCRLWFVPLATIRCRDGHFWATRNLAQLLYGQQKKEELLSLLWILEAMLLICIVAMDYCFQTGWRTGTRAARVRKTSDLC